jgi:hypothetical protein
LMLQGAKILDGVTPPQAPLPLAPERHPAPDGAGGKQTGSTIGSGLPHHLPYGGDTGAGGGSGGNGQDPNSTSAAAVPRSAHVRASKLYGLLKKKGFTDVQIAAILGAWMQESSLNPSAVQNNQPFSTTLVTGHGIGLAQWDRSRKAALLSYANSRKVPWNTYETQVDFFVYELDGHCVEKNRTDAVIHLRSATTLAAANKAMKDYEAFGVAGARIGYANTFMAQIKAKTLP